MKFYSSYNVPPSKEENKCPKTLQNYVFNSVSRKLEKTDTIPFYEEIQSHYESTKLSTKLTRYTMGDITALGFESGSYVDVSGQNTNLATVLNTNEIAKTEFNKLPNDIKQLFGNNFAEFVRCVNDNTVEQKLINYVKQKSNVGSNGIANSNVGTEAAN